MSKRSTLNSLWQRYLSQPTKISPETQEYVAALKRKIDDLEIENAGLRGDLKAMAGTSE